MIENKTKKTVRRVASLLFFISLSLSAQIKGVVVDENDKPIPYVNILDDDETMSTSSDENGKFEMTASNESKILIFSSVGFETKKINSSNAERVVMKLSTIKLQEVSIEKSLATIENELAKFDKDKVHFYYGLGKEQYFLAKFFTYNDTIKQTPFLKSITISTRSQKKNALVKIRLLSPDAEGNPGSDLINENLIFKVKRGNKKSEFDVSKYKLKIAEEGVFVVIELLMVKENEYYMYDKNKKKHTYYTPSIGALPCEEKNLWIYNQNWRKTKNRNPHNYEGQREYFNKYIELAMSLKLTN
ncbi:MAG: carboxypeptidase-like regulatory domain-containing protein [Bacteroidota bacterium]